MFIEAVLPDGRVDVAQDVTLVCPKPDHTWTLDGHLVPPTTFSLSTRHSRPLRPSPEHSFVHPTPTSPSLRSGPAHPTLARPQWGTLEQWEVEQPAYTGTKDSSGCTYPVSGPSGVSGGLTALHWAQETASLHFPGSLLPTWLLLMSLPLCHQP